MIAFPELLDSAATHHRSQQPRRRVLIVSPHFPPINAPDHQRIRVALPYLAQFGWEAEILAVDPAEVPHPQDPQLAQVLPTDLPVTYLPALPASWTSKVGLGNVGWRCLPYLKRAGDRLLRHQSFDLIFFSTTIFPVMTLGPGWQRRFQIPYVLDFQDPWRTDYRGAGRQRPPGGRLKYGVTQALARVCEPHSVRSANQIISVSPAYPRLLQERYPELTPEQFTVLPFGAPEPDFAHLSSLGIQQPIFDPRDGKRHWVYVGRGGDDMAIALRILFTAIAQERQQKPEAWRSIQLHFVGTSYAPPHLAVKTIEPIAQACGIGDLVSEHPQRIPYFAAQQLLVDSDAILLIGSDSASYTASKLYPCILAQKPILALFHTESSVVDILRNCQAGQVVPFRADQPETPLIQQTRQALQHLIHPTPVTTNWAAFQPYTGYEMTRQLCAVFDRAIGVS